LAAIPLLGWGKPTPVNPLRWRNKDLANVMVSLAGILANLLIAIIAFVIFKILLITNVGNQVAVSTQEPVVLFLTYLLIMNVSLAVFNLLPFPPLDGSKILDSILPASMRPALEFLEQYGYLLLIVLIYLGVTRVIITPVIDFVFYLLLVGVR
jgi:Zn-dependent protease